MRNWNVIFQFFFVFEFDALVPIRVLVVSAHVWIRFRIVILIITFMLVSDSDAQTAICIRVGYDRVHVRICVRVGFSLPVGIILVLDLIKLNQCKFCTLVGFLL